MSSAALFWSMKAPVKSLYERAVLSWLGNIARGRICVVRQKTLAKSCLMCERKVREALVALEEAGHITRTPRYHATTGHRKADLITLAVPDQPMPVHPEDVSGDDEHDGLPAPEDGGLTSSQDGSLPARDAAQVSPTYPSSLPNKASSASPQKPCEASAEKVKKPPIPGTADWHSEQCFNVVGPAFKAQFYPTLSGAKFKSRLGAMAKRVGWDLGRVHRAMSATMKAEPSGDAFEYMTKIINKGSDDTGPETYLRGII